MIKFKKDYTQEDIDNGNLIPQYCVSWEQGMSRIGCSFTSKRKAEEVFTRKLNEGRNPAARETRVAGFV